jgi:hypothetical protein
MRPTTRRERDRQEQHPGNDDRTEPGEQRIDGAESQLGHERCHRRERDQVFVVEILWVDLELVLVIERIVDLPIAAACRPGLRIGTRRRRRRGQIEFGPNVVVDPTGSKLSERLLTARDLQLLGRGRPRDAV